MKVVVLGGGSTGEHFTIQTAALQDGDSLVVSIADRPYATLHVTAAP